MLSKRLLTEFLDPPSHRIFDIRHDASVALFDLVPDVALGTFLEPFFTLGRESDLLIITGSEALVNEMVWHVTTDNLLSLDDRHGGEPALRSEAIPQVYFRAWVLFRELSHGHVTLLFAGRF